MIVSLPLALSSTPLTRDRGRARMAKLSRLEERLWEIPNQVDMRAPHAVERTRAGGDPEPEIPNHVDMRAPHAVERTGDPEPR